MSNSKAIPRRSRAQRARLVFVVLLCILAVLTALSWHRLIELCYEEVAQLRLSYDGQDYLPAKGSFNRFGFIQKELLADLFEESTNLAAENEIKECVASLRKKRWEWLPLRKHRAFVEPAADLHRPLVIEAMKSIHRACRSYTHINGIGPRDLPSLISERYVTHDVDPGRLQFDLELISTPDRDGYRLTATPLDGSPRHYFSDPTEIIRYSDNKPAGPESQVFE